MVKKKTKKNLNDIFLCLLLLLMLLRANGFRAPLTDTQGVTRSLINNNRTWIWERVGVCSLESTSRKVVARGSSLAIVNSFFFPAKDSQVLPMRLHVSIWFPNAHTRVSARIDAIRPTGFSRAFYSQLSWNQCRAHFSRFYSRTPRFFYHDWKFSRDDPIERVEKRIFDRNLRK